MGKQYTDEELLRYLKEAQEEVDGSITTTKLNDLEEYPSSVTYQNRFGSWSQAKEKAGLKTPASGGRSYSDDELLEVIQGLAEELDGPVTIKDVNEAEGLPSAGVYKRRFGSWNQAKEEAGLEISGRGRSKSSTVDEDTESKELVPEGDQHPGKYVARFHWGDIFPELKEEHGRLIDTYKKKGRGSKPDEYMLVDGKEILKKVPIG